MRLKHFQIVEDVGAYWFPSPYGEEVSATIIREINDAACELMLPSPYGEEVSATCVSYGVLTGEAEFLIAELLEQQGEIALAQNLRSFSQAVNIGYSPTVQQQVKSLQENLKKRQPQAPFKPLKKFIENFLEPFNQKHESDFQLELAGWYFKNKRYATGYLTMTEAILTYLCEINTKDPDNQDDREAMKALMFQPSYKQSRLSQLYKEINEIRKQIAHPVIGSSETNLSDDIKKADSYHKQLKSIFKSGTWGENLFRSRT